ncbi:DNA-3-methyladenine glycosylase I [Frateuria aurantia]
MICADSPIPATAPGRCRWAQADLLLQTYHDQEWGRPQYDARALWEKLMLDGFQAGLSWRLILQRREALRKAFAGFEPALVAGYAADDVDRIMTMPGMIRSRQKIRAVIHNAHAWLALQAAGEDFGERIWTLAGGRPTAGDGHGLASTSALGDRLSVWLKQHGFQFVGPRICHAWAQACGLINDHENHCFLHTGLPSRR